MTTALTVLLGLVYLATLPLLAWAWTRWVRRHEWTQLRKWPSLLGLILASLSALLAIGSTIHAHHIGGYGYYDPRLMRIYFWGLCLSTAGLLFGLVGLGFQSPSRWQAPAVSLGTLLFWLGCAASE